MPYAGNAKVHTDEQVNEICESIKQFGFSDPIGVWCNPATGDDEVVEGHGRLMAAERLGMDSVPVVRLDRLTDAERRAYAIAHNQLTMDTDFDAEALDAEVSAIVGIDMGAYGFDDPVGAWHDQEGHAVIVEGHGRVLAAQRIGLQTVPVVWLDHMDDEGRRAYGLVHNKLTMDTPWDDDALAADVETLEGIDMSDFGVTLETAADSPVEAAQTGDSPEVETVRFTLAPEQREYVMSALRQVDTSGTETYGNPNGNGNALYEVVVEWQARRTSSSE
ncbi:ParB N-terminal domain-containing protein [Mitsuokella sp.]|uniref:ParB N-terminal domain-containing protein n=1 Tax=Mitsuokella sp. TaxID=2049034 RepID=UPI002A83BBF9|nr:ParB N-terminal domain-containing protein [Mitsuokella sp.]MDY4474712.1 ParB N-terminal domain-containing protein [Mitsuokella sp.]